jgi:hypothetical protein
MNGLSASPDAPGRTAAAIEEWKALRSETLQSQNQRFLAFQISIGVVGVLFAVYLDPTKHLTNEPLVFQSLILLLLVPFVQLVTGLRLRDYDHACYFSLFTRLQVPEIRYTQRNRDIPSSVRKATSSEVRMRRAYFLIAVATTVATLTLALASSSATASWSTRLGLDRDLRAPWWRLILFCGAWALLLKALRVGGHDEKMRKNIFESRMRVCVQELLTGQLVPSGWNTSDRLSPERWTEIFEWESKSNRKLILGYLNQTTDAFPFAAGIREHLMHRWSES